MKKKKPQEEPEEVQRARRTMDILAKDKEAIRKTYKIYCDWYVEQLGWTKDAVVQLIADESRRGKSTIWNIVTYQTESKYEKNDLTTL